MLDLIIKNGRIVDGSGNPWFTGDVGVKDGRIAAVGYVEGDAVQVVDAGRQIVSPGFIDGHCHSDLMILDHPLSEIKLRQGVTAEVVGNCGLAPAPLLPSRADMLQAYIQPVLGGRNGEWPWKSVGEFMDVLAGSAPAEHIATYVAHGSLRIAVMGFENRPAAAAELDRMKALLREGLGAGAIGLSLGLLYAPGSYSSREELESLCAVLPEFGGILSTHIRGEGNNLLPSVGEVIRIAEKAGVPLHISHLKAAGRSNWGKVSDALELIEDARARGLDVTCDVYPYAAGSTSLTTLLPPWALEGGIDRTLGLFRDARQRRRLKDELESEQAGWDNLVLSTGWQSVVVSAVNTSKNVPLEGRSIADIAEDRSQHPADCMMDLLLEENGRISIVYFHMADDDVAQVIGYEKALIASDSLTCETGKPHPRLYGTFPRVFAEYVRNRKRLTLEEAVRKLTSFPAQRFRLGRRGLLVPGYSADIVVFDPDTIQDTATYQEPRRYPEGISHVIVSGVPTLSHGAHTNARPGTLIRADSRCSH